jgi:hypothetical protein
MEIEESSGPTIIAQFVTEQGEKTGSQLNIPLNTTTSQLEMLVNHLLSNVRSKNFHIVRNLA